MSNKNYLLYCATGIIGLLVFVVLGGFKEESFLFKMGFRCLFVTFVVISTHMTQINLSQIKTEADLFSKILIIITTTLIYGITVFLFITSL